MQFGNTWRTDFVRLQSRFDTRHEQSLGGINVAHAHHHIARQQHLLDRCCAFFQTGLKQLQLKAIGQGLHAQLAKQFQCRFMLFRGRPHGRAKATRVVQAQCALAGDQVHVVMFTGGHLRWCKVETARHAQVQQQNAAVHVQQQVLAAPAYLHNGLPHQHRWRHTQGPTQRFAHVQSQNACTCDPAGKTQPGDFYFWQFRH